MTDLAGAMVQLYAYDAYGNAIGFDPAAALTEFLYSGEQFDAKIGQQYLRQRYYDPSTGRFNRLDPFFGNQTDPQSFHKYLYCHADPVNGIDPSGKFVISLGLGMLCGGSLRVKDGVKIGIGQTVREAFFYTGAGITLGTVVSGIVTKATGEFSPECIGAGMKLGFGLFVARRKGENELKKALVTGLAEAMADGVPLLFKTLVLSTGYLVPYEQLSASAYWGQFLSSVFQSFSNGVYTEAMNERYKPNEVVSLLVQVGETVLASVLYDNAQTPPLTNAQITVNAVEAGGAKLSAWLVTQPFAGLSDDIVEAAFTSAVIGGVVEFITMAFDVFGGINYR